MRNLRKLTVALLIVALMSMSMTAVFAADANVANADKAATLKDLGLYSGQDANDPKVGLEGALTTQDSLIFLSKLFGYYESANNLSSDQIAEALAKFDDAASISNYAKNVVAYSATNGILNGSTQNGKFFIGAKDTVTAARFATFMLKQMGYTVPDYKLSIAQLAELSGSRVDAALFGDLTRDSSVGIMYGALTAEKLNGKTVIADIVGENADLKAKAEKLGLLEPPPAPQPNSNSTSSDSSSSGSSSSGSNSSGSGSSGSTSKVIKVVSVNFTHESIQITFNEKLNIDVATNLDNYLVQKLSDNQTIPLAAQLDDSKKSVELKFLSQLEDNTTYQLLIKNYKDIYGNKNTSDYKHIFTTSDCTPPQVFDDLETKQHCFAIAEKGKIFIVYSEAMNETQMLNKENYQISINEGNTYMNLSDDDTITKINARMVQIYVKELENQNDSAIKPYVKILPITDLAGNRLYNREIPYIVQNIEPENVYIEKAQLIAKNLIKVVFNKKMEIISAQDIALTNLAEPDSINIVACGSPNINNDGKTEIVLILDKELSTDVTDIEGLKIDITTVANPSSESEWGGKLKPNLSILLGDKVAPEIVTWDHDDDELTDDIAMVIVDGDLASAQVYDHDYTVPQNTTGSITIHFSEDIKESALEVDTFNVTGFTITDIEAPVETKTIILTVRADADYTSIKATVTQVSEIYDTADNAFAAGSEWKVTLADGTLAN